MIAPKATDKNPGEVLSIPRQEYEKLVRDSLLLDALACAGVDSWEGYEVALEMLNEGEQ